MELPKIFGAVQPDSSDFAFEKVLPDGRVIRVQERMYNSQLTISPSIGSPFWDDGF